MVDYISLKFGLVNIKNNLVTNNPHNKRQLLALRNRKIRIYDFGHSLASDIISPRKTVYLLYYSPWQASFYLIFDISSYETENHNFVHFADPPNQHGDEQSAWKRCYFWRFKIMKREFIIIDTLCRLFMLIYETLVLNRCRSKYDFLGETMHSNSCYSPCTNLTKHIHSME